MAILVGYVPTVAFPWWDAPWALGAGVLLILLILLVVGRSAPPAPAGEPAPLPAAPPAGPAVT